MAGASLSAHPFLQGTRVGAYPRSGDTYPGVDLLGNAESSATSDGTEVVFKNLRDGQRYWAVGVVDGNERHKAFTAKPERPDAKVRVEPSGRFNPQLVPRVQPGVEIVTGATGTKVAGRTVHEPLPKGLDEAHPHLNQASIAGTVPQRSSTPLGQATPVDPGEVHPKPRQEDVKQGVKQMSDTPTGEATPIVSEAGPEPQEDASKRLKQRSDTEDGEQTPIGSAEPRGTASNPQSVEQAAGVRTTDTKKAATKAAVKAAPGAAKVKKRK